MFVLDVGWVSGQQMTLGVLPHFRISLMLFSNFSLKWLKAYCITNTKHHWRQIQTNGAMSECCWQGCDVIKPMFVKKIITAPTNHLRQSRALTCWERHYKGWDQTPAQSNIFIFGCANIKLDILNIACKEDDWMLYGGHSGSQEQRSLDLRVSDPLLAVTGHLQD